MILEVAPSFVDLVEFGVLYLSRKSMSRGLIHLFFFFPGHLLVSFPCDSLLYLQRLVVRIVFFFFFPPYKYVIKGVPY